MLKVAVVDTNIEINRNSLKKYISTGQINIHDIEQINAKNCEHGSSVVEIILKECPTVHIDVFPILNESKRGSIKNLCKVIATCIDLNISLVNLSLGVSDVVKESNEKSRLEKLCMQARNKGIIIVAARNNHGDSCPASLETVVGVGSCSEIGCAIKVDTNKRDVIFQNNFVFFNRDRKMLIKGNSYLAAIISGVLCNRLLCDNYLGVDRAIEYIRHALEKNQNELWLMSIGKLKEKILHQKVAFLKISESEDENSIRKFYEKHSEFASYKFTQFEILKNKIKSYHYLAIGLPQYNCNQEYESLVQLLNDVSCNVDIILSVPIISLSQRIYILENNKNSIYSLYF